jgi:hypothetical protein
MRVRSSPLQLPLEKEKLITLAGPEFLLFARNIAQQELRDY